MNACVEKEIVAAVVPVIAVKVIERVECEDLKARSQQAKKNRYKRRYH